MSRLKYLFTAIASAVLLVVLATVHTALGDTAPPPLAQKNALAGTAGCGKAPTLTSGTQSITSSGKNRSYILRIPDNYDRNTPYRLIFGFHWNGGTANDVDGGRNQSGTPGPTTGSGSMVEQQRDLRLAPGLQQRLGQLRR